MWTEIKAFLFENRSNRQTVAKNTFWLGASNIGGRLLRAIIIIFSARVLGAADYGIFSYALTLAAFLTIFIDLGVNQILAREFAKTQDPGERIRIISTAFFLKMGLLVLSLLVVLFVAPRFATLEGAVAILPWVALILAFDSLRDFGLYLCRALERMEWEALVSLIMNAVIVGAGFLFLSVSRTVQSLAMAYALGTAVGAVVVFFVVRNHIKGIFTNFSRKLVGFIALAAWPFAISGLLGGLMINTDVLLIGWLRTASEVGLYSAAQRIVQILYTLPGMLALSVLPMFSRLAGKDPEKFRRVFEQLLASAFLVAIPLMVGGVILGPQIIAFLFGGEYAPATLSFQILMVTLIVDFPAVLLTSAVFTHNRQKDLVLYAALGGFANLFLDLLLIPMWGIAGSAVATLLCQILANLYLWRTMRKLNYFEVLPRLKNILIAAACMGAVVGALSLLSLPVLLLIAVGVAIYFGTLIALGEPIVQEFKMMLGAETPA